MSTKSIKNSPDNIEKLAIAIGEDRLKRNYPLSEVTWMKVGGPADLFFVARRNKDFIDIVTLCKKYHVDITVLGGGSNILVKDGGIRGLVVQNRTNHITLAGVKGGVIDQKTGISSVMIRAESGTFVNQLVRYCIEESLQGLEEFLGIPGTVGGAVYNNSHHLQHLIGDYVSEVEVIDLDGNIKTYSQKDMKFAYDYSVLQETGGIILTTTFKLSSGVSQDLWKKAEAALKRRRDTQPLEMPSSGCMFKNIGEDQAIEKNTPDHSTSAGFLIDKAGMKGMKVGGAVVSDVHANFIVNEGEATARDIQELVSLVEDKIKTNFGVTLEREVFFIGED